MEINATILERALQTHFPQHAQGAFPYLMRYLHELHLWGSRMNLTAQADAQSLQEQIIDSLSAYRIIEEYIDTLQTEQKDITVRIADIGSGNGLPGIPLAVLFPESHMTLIEIQQKRCGFLSNVVALLKLPNVTVQMKRFESLTDTYHIVLARALAQFDTTVSKNLCNITKHDGMVVAYKSKNRSLSHEQSALLQHFHTVRQVEPLIALKNHCFLVAVR